MARRKSTDGVANIYDLHMNAGRSTGIPENVATAAYLESMYRRIITELAISRYQWVGMPESVDVRFLEHTLFHTGLVVFYFNHKYGRYMGLKASGNGYVNMYNNPTQFMVFGNTMVNEQLKVREDKLVPIWNNQLRTGDADIALVYAYKLAQMDRTIEMNAMATRHPFLIAATDEIRNSLENIWKKIQEGAPAIIGTEGLIDVMKEQIAVFTTGVSDEIVLNNMIAKAKIWNECMTMLGIDNANQEKRERVVVDEVNANNKQVEAIRFTGLTPRNQACEQIKRVFDLDVRVEWRSDPGSMPTQQPINVSGGELDGNFHN